MASAKYLQTSFLGGEWSKTSQGRADRQDYRSAMNLCRNALPIEEGAVVRRPGFKQAGITRNGLAGRLIQFHFSQAAPYLLELTEGFARTYSGNGLAVEVGTSVTGISAATPAVITSVAHGLVTGNQVILTLTGAPDTNYGTIAAILGKQFSVIRLTADTFSISDVLLGNFDGSRVTLGTNVVVVHKIVEFVTPWSDVPTGGVGSVADVRAAQDENELLLFQQDYQTQVLTSLTDENGDIFATFSFEEAVFLDGPYLDPFEDGNTLTPSALSGTVTITSATTAFLPGDPGRLIRLFSEPEDWDAATTYAAGDAVKYDDTYWTALKSTTGDIPGVDLEAWAIDTSAAAWTWGTITVYHSATSVDVSLADADPAGVKAGGDLLYLHAIKTWRMGLYSNSNGYPTCGTFHEGRLWLGGRIGNRIDSSMSNKTFDFSPTLRDGTVADNCGISATFRATGINRPLWLMPDDQGVIVGTQAGEWLVRASQLNDPLTPTSIQAHRPTDFGSEAIEPVITPLAKLFVQRAGTKLIELTATYPPKYISGQDIALTAKHFWEDGVAEIAYQALPTPVIWARTNAGELIGCTYRRDSQFSNQPITFAGWHKHEHGGGRTFVSIQTGPSVGGDSDALSAITFDPDFGASGTYYVETLTPVFTENADLLDAWYVDGGANPTGADIITSESPHVIRFYGLDYASGQTLSVWVAGLDLGDFYVESDGTLDVRLDGDNGNANPLLTLAYLNSVSGSDYTYGTTIIPEPGAAGNSTTSPANASFYSIDAGEDWTAATSSPVVTSTFGSYTTSFYLSTTWLRTAEPDFGQYDVSLGETLPAGYFSYASFNITLPDCYIPGTDFSVDFTGQMVGTNIGSQGIVWKAVQVEGSWFSDTPSQPYPNGTTRKVFNTSSVPAPQDMFPFGDTGNNERTVTGYPIPGIGKAQIMQAGSWVTTGAATLLPGEQVSLMMTATIGRDVQLVVPSPTPGDAVYEVFSLYMRVKNVSAVVPYDCGGGNTVVVPTAIGNTYTSQCQIVRPVAPNEAGTQLGPAVGNTRRSHQFTALLLNTQAISFGTEFANLRPIEFRTPGGTAYMALELFSGTHEGTIEDNYSYDSMICWSVTRPFPACVLAIGGFLKGQDR